MTYLTADFDAFLEFLHRNDIIIYRIKFPYKHVNLYSIVYESYSHFSKQLILFI